MSMAVSAALTIGKFLIAFFTGSLGVLSEALHSLIDFGATVVTWFAVRWADLPADEDHHYGHAKIESLAALLESVLLVATAIFVAYEAVHRLIQGSAPPELTWWAPTLIMVAIVVDYNRASALAAVAKAQVSEALAADAAHFQSDMFGSVAVLLGLIGVTLGFPWADSVAALAVAILILWIAKHLAEDAIATLLDRAPEGLTGQIRSLIVDEDGILHIDQLRIRQAGRTTYISLLADVPRSFSADQIEKLKAGLAEKISKVVPEPDLSFVLRPVALDSETANEKVQAVAKAHGVLIHHLIVQQLEGKLAVSFDVEFDGATTLFDAHERATDLEDAIRDGLGGKVEVESHVEPRPMQMIEGNSADAKRTAALDKALRKFATAERGMSDVHNVRVRQNGSELYLHYHCRFAPQQGIAEVHEVLDRVEGKLKQQFTQLIRVVAHAEPVGRAVHNL